MGTANRTNITKRSDKSTALTHPELDQNFDELGNVIDDQVNFETSLGSEVSTGNGALKVRGSVIYVDTIADLQALPTSGLVDGQEASVNGTGFKWYTDQSEWLPTGMLNVRSFGAVGNGVADDTAAVHAAMQEAADKRAGLFFPAGEYRVTAGFDNNVAYNDLHLYGEGRSFERIGASTITLDSTDPGSYFYTASARHFFTARNLQFRCSQFVKDRRFFYFNATLSTFGFDNTGFGSVEKPIVLGTSLYFQSCYVRNTQFRSSGTIHSELPGGDTTLLGRILTIDNVNHETFVPENTEKEVCNLNGIDSISVNNFLLEGVLPSTGWTILSLGRGYDITSNWIATLSGFWSEWSGDTKPAKSVVQYGGKVRLTDCETSAFRDYSPYEIKDGGFVDMEGQGFYYPTFITEDDTCTVRVRGGAKKYNLYSNQIIDDYEIASNTDTIGEVRGVSNGDTYPLVVYKGGYLSDYFDDVLALSSSVQPVVLSDGRRVLRLSASGRPYLRVGVKSDVLTVGDTIWFSLKLSAPTATGDTPIRVRMSVQGVDFSYHDEDIANGDTINILTPRRVTAESTANAQIIIDNATDYNNLGDGLIIDHLAVYVGRVAPNFQGHTIAKKVVTYATSQPSNGIWERGDIVYHSEPTSSSDLGWVCISAGAPGSWRAF